MEGGPGQSGHGWITPHVFRKPVATVIGLDDVRAAADQPGPSGTVLAERHYVVRTHQGPDGRAALERFGVTPDAS